MKKYYLMMSLLLGGLMTAQSQSLSSTVVGNAGSYWEAGEFGSLHFTVGEMAVARLDNQIELGEGFHRVETELIVFTQEVSGSPPHFQVYPNPTRDYLIVESELPDRYHLTLVNAAGRAVLPSQSGQHQTRINTQALAGGQYWLQVRDEQGELVVFPIVKVRW